MESRFIKALVCLVAVFLPTLLCAGEDPGDAFLKAYRHCKAGEQLEQKNDSAKAIEQYRSAEAVLLQIMRQYPQWQTSVISHRLNIVQRSISSLEIQTAGVEQPVSPENNVEHPGENTASSYAIDNVDYIPVEDIEGGLPIYEESDGAFHISSISLTPPSDEYLKPRPALAAPTIAAPSLVPSSRLASQGSRLLTDAAAGTPQEVVSQILQQIAQLQHALNDSQNEKQKLTLALQTSAMKVRIARDETDNVKVDMALLRTQLGEAHTMMVDLQDSFQVTLRERLEKETATLKSQLTENQSRLTDLSQQNTDLTGKLETSTARVEELSAQLGEAEKNSETFQKETKELTVALSDANTKIDSLSLQIAERDKTIAEKIQEAADLNSQITLLQKTLEETPETQEIVAENELLRNLVLRQLRQQSQRAQAGQALESELAQLNVSTDSIRENIDLLSRPVVEITDDERRLFKNSVALMGDSSAPLISGELVITKSVHEVPEALRSDVRSAKESFDSGDFDRARGIYEKLSSAHPDNYFFLTNLGAVEIETDRISNAETSLRKAIHLAPDEDSYAHTLLGIVLTRQGREKESLAEFEKAIHLNPGDAIAHNYLGVYYAQVADIERSESHFQKAIEASPTYADAHFNLAVFYATAKNPSPDLARRHYQKATELGASPNSSLEKLIR